MISAELTDSSLVPTRDKLLAEVMELSLKEAVSLTQRVNTIPWQNEDVRSIALTMFIQRARSH